ncbi:ABC transporter ATP-binding protein [Sphaerobacter thermophilus]|jgi:ABC-2 type transport system ATP-binding protein|uniref:ABC transporter related protein n=1 Tax=Sphaerobacter thermophilus (strain ATCC 49802 / DSM 20745 / KCCM 41009 / NCIMB 13125 / S 6022) TaxID=479434 RepID=D1C6I0_SPHTD|nr:ABC transporter ATP-binding protein [Sphaerobacter thermophilus]ACZ39605.1 ABC transporter related protein [Sphaerobacter thermophilus DSM 20745]PZN64770.1 MAG: ABC transporter ATP-binding protein [Sphaerobacter thermophilus]
MTSTADHAIVVQHLVKSYGGKRAVDDLSFSVRRGEIFALLGPNGAGKTTTVEILEGYRAPDSGTVHVLGLDPQRDAAQLKQRIGVMLQQGGIYPTVTASELLHLFRHFYRDPEDPEALIDLVGLRESAHVRYRQLSGGQQRRLALAAALIGKPELLFLDEPTTAMDPQARHLTWGIIRELRERGLTVLLTTHFMEEAERLADRVAIIDHGRLIALEEPKVLTQANAEEVQFTAPPGLDLATLAALPAANSAREPRPGFYVIATTRPADLLAEVTAWARDAGILLNDLRVGHESLEDVFLRLTGHELRE